MPPPKLTKLDPTSAREDTSVTLSGSGFGERTAASAVRFAFPEPNATAVAATVTSWKAEAIEAIVPKLASFGSGGELDVTVATGGGVSDPLTFVLLEASRPAIAALEPPARGLPGKEVAVHGTGFGRRTSESAVLFAPEPRNGADAPGDVAAGIVAWSPNEITVVIPSLVDLNGAGPKRVVVRTPWGRSDPADFVLGELPTIRTLDRSPSPGARMTVEGAAFGDEPGELRLTTVFEVDDPNSTPHVVVPPVLSWEAERIVVRIPELGVLGTTGPKDVTIETEWGVSDPERIVVESRASITTHTRVEPHARTSDVDRSMSLGLEAQVADALWLVGRQWQLLELEGEDAGSPVEARVRGACARLARWQPFTGEPEDLPAGVPLEAVVERERVLAERAPGVAPFGDVRLSAEAGLQLLRILDVHLADPKKADTYRKRFLKDFPLKAATEQALDAESRRFLAVMAERAPDGSRLYAELQSSLPPTSERPAKPPINGNDVPAVLAAVEDWYAWCESLFSEASPGRSAWNRERMEYGFSVAAGDVVLDAREHDGGRLDWYSFTRRAPGTTLGAPGADAEAVAFRRDVLPTVVEYPGMPRPRWWQLESTAVNFGAVAAGPSELLKLVLVEFATVFGNDWFSVPLDALPVPSLCRIDSVVVRDTFGVETPLSPFGDGAGSDWRLFEPAAEDGSADAGNLLLLPDSLPSTLESPPLEDVLFLRDELANLAWAVERVVESPVGRPLDRHEDEVAARAAPPPPGSGSRRYVLQSPVPRNWIPLVPKPVAANGGGVTRRLARGALRGSSPGETIQPRGRVLEPGTSLELYDEEVPRAGARVVRIWQLGRAANGETHLWRGRRKRPGRGEASSGLRFDQAPREP